MQSKLIINLFWNEMFVIGDFLELKKLILYIYLVCSIYIVVYHVILYKYI